MSDEIDELKSMLQAAFPKSQEQTLKDSVDDHAEEIVNLIDGSSPMKSSSPVTVTKVKDSYGNSVLSVGTEDKVAAFSKYTFSNDTLNYPLWLALYNDSWVFRRAIDKPAQDEIRAGVNLDGLKDKTAVYKDIKKLRFDLIKLAQWGALTGGSVGCLMFDNVKDEDYKMPLSDNVISKYKIIRCYVTDRWYGCAPSDETVTDMNDIDFGKPKYYNITFPDGHQVLFHHSYVLRYEHRTAPNLIKNGQLQGWGYAEGSHILNELMRDDKLKTSIQSLVDKSLIEVIKMSGMRGVFMGTDSVNQDQLRKRLEMVNWGRNFNSLTFLDKEDEYSQNTYSGLGGLSDILQQNMWQVAAALEMQGVLFGDLKSGFSNDNEAMERYDETINGRCESYLRPIYEKLLTILYKHYKIDEKVEFTFNSLLMKKQSEEKMTSISTFVDLCAKLQDMGVLSARKVGESLMKFINNGTVDLGLDEKALNELDDKIEQETEGFEFETEKENAV